MTISEKMEDLNRFRDEFPQRIQKIDGSRWAVIDSAEATVPENTVPASGSADNRDVPPLVLFPGTLGTGEIFWQQIRALSPRMRVIALTYPALTDVNLYADQAATLLEGRGIERFSVLGSSLGGFTAQVLAARHPDRVEILFAGNTLCDPQASWWPKNLSAVDIKRTPPSEVKAARLKAVEDWPESDPGLALAKAVIREQGQSKIPPRHLKARILALLAAEAVPPLSIPDSRIVTIECADDPIIPPEAREEVRARYPGAEQHILPSGGHFPYISRAEDYTAILEKRLLG